ncbi:phosphopantetheine-binding protein [Corynebacterium terpenotabidum]|uniref:Isochorismatase n=1 Tax=Corynebacterium terpenotabidum Y-11 TaxID=1200352 RepID=S4XEM4_9CORY|nr:phosphopantetheine-binding protein [Corynebacterium terpenotabidum]AGP31597.1 isochorismatase [Corynebacterium terpenotabidum Y-11]
MDSSESTASTASIDEVMEELMAKVAVLMNTGVEDLDPDEELMDQGLDSVRLVEVVTFLREAGYHADFADLAEESSLNAWRELLEDLAQ